MVLVLETIAKRALQASVVDKANTTLKAFTLAEVLIILGIIGLIADMTIPTLKNKIDKTINVTRLQKAYSSLEQAIRLSEIDNGPANSWEEWDDASVIVDKYLAPKMTVLKNYGKAASWQKAMCYENDKNNPNTAGIDTQYVWNDRVHISTPFSKNTASFKLADGTCIGVNPKNDHSGRISIDTNGNQKGPNMAGKDLFFFYLNEKGLLKPLGDTLTYEELIDPSTTNSCADKITYIGGGICATRIMHDGWKITYDW